MSNLHTRTEAFKFANLIHSETAGLMSDKSVSKHKVSMRKNATKAFIEYLNVVINEEQCGEYYDTLELFFEETDLPSSIDPVLWDFAEWLTRFQKLSNKTARLYLNELMNCAVVEAAIFNRAKINKKFRAVNTAYKD